MSPAAILRRRHRREGAAPLSPAAILRPWGAATEFAGCFNRLIIPAMVIGRVIVRRVIVRVRRVLVAMGVRVAVTLVREVRSAVLRQNFRFRQCRRCGFRFMENKRSCIGVNRCSIALAGRVRHPQPRLRPARCRFRQFRESQTSFRHAVCLSTLLPRDFRRSEGVFDPPSGGSQPFR